MRRVQFIVSVVAVAATIGIGSIGTAGVAHAAEVPSAEVPATAAPATGTANDVPATDAPATDAPATDQPATDQPATDAPATDAPDTAPTDPTAPPASMAPPAPQALTNTAPAVTAIAPFTPGTHRLAGDDRFATAVEISKRYAPRVPVVYLATGTDFPDALAAAAAAAHRGGPLLLTMPDALPEIVRAELVRLAPDRIVVAGGEAAVGDVVLEQLTGLAPAIERVGGADRYQTAERLVADAFTSASEAFVATGWSFPDALTASAAAGARGAPVVLVDGFAGWVRSSTIDLVEGLGVRSVRIAGGPAAISPAAASGFDAPGRTVTRYEGADRYLTAAAINSALFSPAVVDDAFLATGEGFADALAGAALAGATDSPLFIVRPSCIPEQVGDVLGGLAPDATIVLGGPSALDAGVEAGVACPMPWVKPASGRITDGFGPREPICTPGGCTQSVHRGTDLGTGCWAPIVAAADGRITTAGRVGTYGNFIKIAHGDGIDTGYAHLVDGGILVGVGQYVAAGQQIGWTGATGAATGCHLHFEVYRGGTQIDPVPFMAAFGAPLG